MKARFAIHLHAALLLTLLICGAAAADAVKLSGFWIEGVNVRSVGEGELVYATATGGEVVKPLSEVEGIRLQAYPELQQAVSAAEAGDHAGATDLLRQVKQKSRQDWIDRYATKLLVTEAAAAGEPLDAVRWYVELLRDQVDSYFVPEAPVQAVSAAPEAVKQRVAAIVEPAIERLTGDRRAALQGLLDAATKAPAAPGAAEPAAEPAAEAAAESAVTLPQDIVAGVGAGAAADAVVDPVVELLRKGEFQQALTAAQAAVQTGGRLSDKLYLLGMAQLSLAEQSGDAKLYKDAGLSFMRVAVYFPRSGVAGPAVLEAGYVHEKIGREDLARKLYDRARLAIDPEAEPAYHQRLLDLTQ